MARRGAVHGELLRRMTVGRVRFDTAKGGDPLASLSDEQSIAASESAITNTRFQITTARFANLLEGRFHKYTLAMLNQMPSRLRDRDRGGVPQVRFSRSPRDRGTSLRCRRT